MPLRLDLRLKWEEMVIVGSGFPRGRQPEKDANLLFGQNFAENCMKNDEYWTGGRP